MVFQKNTRPPNKTRYWRHMSYPSLRLVGTFDICHELIMSLLQALKLPSRALAMDGIVCSWFFAGHRQACLLPPHTLNTLWNWSKLGTVREVQCIVYSTICLSQLNHAYSHRVIHKLHHTHNNVYNMYFIPGNVCSEALFKGKVFFLSRFCPWLCVK